MLLIYAGFIGGLGTDRGKGIALDSSGDVFVVGETNSDHASFPKKIGPDTTQNGDFDAFVAKLCVLGCADVSGHGERIRPTPCVLGKTSRTRSLLPITGLIQRPM